eukprot:781438-Prorocentrum_minimum.AAC.1
MSLLCDPVQEAACVRRTSEAFPSSLLCHTYVTLRSHLCHSYVTPFKRLLVSAVPWRPPRRHSYVTLMSHLCHSYVTPFKRLLVSAVPRRPPRRHSCIWGIECNLAVIGTEGPWPSRWHTPTHHRLRGAHLLLPLDHLRGEVAAKDFTAGQDRRKVHVCAHPHPRQASAPRRHARAGRACTRLFQMEFIKQIATA